MYSLSLASGPDYLLFNGPGCQPERPAVRDRDRPPEVLPAGMADDVGRLLQVPLVDVMIPAALRNQLLSGHPVFDLEGKND
jgi:hypothetical protein